jgi:pyruvate ferredoxin oxidoreductase beta subunit
MFYGHKACGGCGGSLTVRLAMKVLGKKSIGVYPPNCMSTVGFIYPHMCYFGNATTAPFAASGAVMSGLRAGADALGHEDWHVYCMAGDGGTADIGIQALSGAIDRNDRVIYICYDNEAYMNTGIQKSGLTPTGTRTTNTPAGSNIHGAIQPKKRIFEIVAAHGIPYAATASVGYPEDYLRKLEKAAACPGTSFIHVLAPCPTGWQAPSEITIELAKEAVDTGMWFLAEYENGQYHLNKNPKEFASIEAYLKKQGRFSHMVQADFDELAAQRDEQWGRMRAEWCD